MRLKETYNKMPTHKITPSQLRGMIKEALEESLEEISLDDERMELARLGLSRTPEQNRRYKELLEAKLGYMNEGIMDTLSSAGKALGKLLGKGKGAGILGKISDLSKDGMAKALIPVFIDVLKQQDIIDADALLGHLKSTYAKKIQDEVQAAKSGGTEEKKPGGFKRGLV